MRSDELRGIEADDWDRHWLAYAGCSEINPAQRYRHRLLVEELAQNGEPSRIVDIGAGTGEMAEVLCAAFPNAPVLGLELSGVGVELARRRVPEARFVQRDLLEPANPEEYAEWGTHAVCSEVLEHVEKPALLLRNALQYLADGSRVLVTVPAGPMSALDRQIGHRRHYTTDDLAAVLGRAGLEIQWVRRAGFPFFNLYRIAVVAYGKRLVEAAAGRDDRPASRPALVGMRFFDFLFRLNTTNSPFGWQLIASARVSRRSVLWE